MALRISTLVTLSALAACVMLVAGDRHAEAGAALPISASGDHAGGTTLVVRAKLQCNLVNGTLVCSKKKKSDKNKTPPAPAPATAPEPASGQCNLCTNKGECSPAGTPAECADHKAAAEKLNVTPFLKWSCVCK